MTASLAAHFEPSVWASFPFSSNVTPVAIVNFLGTLVIPNLTDHLGSFLSIQILGPTTDLGWSLEIHFFKQFY